LVEEELESFIIFHARKHVIFSQELENSGQFNEFVIKKGNIEALSPYFHKQDLKGNFLFIYKYVSCTECNTASSTTPQNPLSRKMLELNSGPL